MNEAQAIKELELKYASVEDFALTVFTHPKRKELMSDKVSWEKKAGYLGLSTKATTVVLAMSKRFQRSMKELSISNRWNFEAQDAANAQFIADTTNEMEKPGERVKVAQYLNRESGIGVEDKEQKGGVVINLSFGGASLEELMASMGADEKTITLDPAGNPVAGHRSRTSGESEPEGVKALRAGSLRRISSTESLLPEAVPRPKIGDESTGVARSPIDVVTVAESASRSRTEGESETGSVYGNLAARLLD